MSSSAPELFQLLSSYEADAAQAEALFSRGAPLVQREAATNELIQGIQDRCVIAAHNATKIAMCFGSDPIRLDAARACIESLQGSVLDLGNHTLKLSPLYGKCLSEDVLGRVRRILIANHELAVSLVEGRGEAGAPTYTQGVAKIVQAAEHVSAAPWSLMAALQLRVAEREALVLDACEEFAEGIADAEDNLEDDDAGQNDLPDADDLMGNMPTFGAEELPLAKAALGLLRAVHKAFHKIRIDIGRWDEAASLPVEKNLLDGVMDVQSRVDAFVEELYGDDMANVGELAKSLTSAVFGLLREPSDMAAGEPLPDLSSLSLEGAPPSLADDWRLFFRHALRHNLQKLLALVDTVGH